MTVQYKGNHCCSSREVWNTWEWWRPLKSLGTRSSGLTSWDIANIVAINVLIVLPGIDRKQYDENPFERFVEALVMDWVCRLGIPLKLHSDRGRKRNSSVSECLLAGHCLLLSQPMTMWNTYELQNQLISRNIYKIVIPRMDSGLDKLEWRIIRNMLEIILQDTAI